MKVYEGKRKVYVSNPTTKKTIILSGDECRGRILSGVNQIADVVTITLGARGRNVGIAMSTDRVEIFRRDIIHDGVRVSKEVHLEDEFENFAAAVLREAAEKTVMEVGDGTTVTILLAQAMYQEAFKAISNGVDPVQLKENLEKRVKELGSKLESFSTLVDTFEKSLDIATISCQDKEIGLMIAEALEKLGTDGVINVEESRNNTTSIEYQQGMQFDKGWYKEHFITDLETMTATLENPYLLITDKTITSLEPMVNMLNDLFSRQASLVIVSPSITPEACSTLIQNKVMGKLSVLYIQAPSFGDNQIDSLKDIAYLTGATFISADADIKFETITIQDLGRCDYVKSDKSTTLISGGRGKKEVIEARVNSIKTALEEETDDFKQEKMRERLGKLSGGIAIIYVGGLTEIEMKERRERIVDAVWATRSARKKGIVPGGEVTFLALRQFLDTDIEIDKLLDRVLQRPFIKLVQNAGLDAEVMMFLLDKGNHNYWGKGAKRDNLGVDLRDGKVKDLIKAGIIDPLLVLENALYNSCSVACQLILTEAIIVPFIPGNRKEV